jgi:uncharacterized protein (DUF1697 family)
MATTTRYVAFLRAINVGGRIVTMAALKKPFEQLGFTDVETFIASGNVVFRTPRRSTARLEAEISEALFAALGYEVATFVRTDREVASLARCKPFPEAAMRAAQSVNVGFVASPIDAPTRAALMALTTEIDTFHIDGREIYWMCKKRQSESKISNVVLERALKIRSTFRGLNTVVRLAEKLTTT